MMALIRRKGALPTLQSIQEPGIQSPDDVKIQIMYSTLCRDDMRTSDEFNVFGYGVMGHEATGVITDAGSRAQSHGFRPGCRVALLIFESCGKCKNCLSQKPQYCAEVHLAGGVLTEFVVRKFNQLILLPEWLSYRQASLLEPVGDVLCALKKAEIGFNSDILLIGSGFLGLVTIRILHMLGVKKIAVIEPLPERRRMALQNGADITFAPDDPDLQVSLLKATDFQGFDTVIDTSARPDIFSCITPCISSGACFLLLAYTDVHEKVSLPVLHMYSRNMRVIWSSLCSKRDMEAAIHITYRLKLDELITAEYPFSKSDLAYQEYLGTDELKIGILFS